MANKPSEVPDIEAALAAITRALELEFEDENSAPRTERLAASEGARELAAETASHSSSRSDEPSNVIAAEQERRALVSAMDHLIEQRMVRWSAASDRIAANLASLPG